MRVKLLAYIHCMETTTKIMNTKKVEKEKANARMVGPGQIKPPSPFLAWECPKVLEDVLKDLVIDGLVYEQVVDECNIMVIIFFLPPVQARLSSGLLF